MTSEQIAFAALHLGRGITFDAVARMAGLTRQEVQEVAAMCGISPPRRKNYTPPPVINWTFRYDRIIQEVAAKHGLTPADLKGDRRHRNVAHARQEAYARIQAECGLSTSKIGQIFGGRDHTTVVDGLQKYKARMASKERKAA